MINKILILGLVFNHHYVLCLLCSLLSLLLNVLWLRIILFLSHFYWFKGRPGTLAFDDLFLQLPNDNTL